MSLRNSLILSVRWHRRIGLFCIFFVFVLSITGLLLNHTSSLKLDSIKLHSPLLASLYGLPTLEPQAFPLASQWLVHDGASQLYLNDTPVGECGAPLLGAVTHNGLLHVLCHKELLLLSPEGELLESITSVLGLPANVKALALYNDQLFINTEAGAIIANLETLQWQPTDKAPEQWLTPQPLPDQLSDKITSQAPAIDLEQVLLDLHSGRLFGGFGVLVMDLAAILLIVLSITGFIAWNSSRRIRKATNLPRRTRHQG